MNINDDSKYIPRHSDDYMNRNNGANITKKTVVLRRKRRRLKVKWVIVLLIIFVVVILYSLFKIFNWGMDNRKTSEITKNIEDNVEINLIDDNSNTEIINEEKDKDNPYWYYITFPLIDVNIKELKSQNSDTVGCRNGTGVWLRCAFEPDASSCRKAALEFIGVGAAARIVADGTAGRSLWVPSAKDAPEPERLVSEVTNHGTTQIWHTSCPAEFTPEDILAAHAESAKPNTHPNH